MKTAREEAQAVLEALLPDGRTRLRACYERLLMMFQKGDLRAFEILEHRAYGKPEQPVSGADGGPLAVLDIFVLDDPPAEPAQ
jgi:hypothetical protein